MTPSEILADSQRMRRDRPYCSANWHSQTCSRSRLGNRPVGRIGRRARPPGRAEPSCGCAGAAATCAERCGRRAPRTRIRNGVVGVVVCARASVAPLASNAAGQRSSDLHAHLLFGRGPRPALRCDENADRLLAVPPYRAAVAASQARSCSMAVGAGNKPCTARWRGCGRCVEAAAQIIWFSSAVSPRQRRSRFSSSRSMTPSS